MTGIMPQNRYVLVAAITTLTFLFGGCDSDDAVGIQQIVVSDNLAPFFQGIKGAITAGGARILVCWEAATDDNDASPAIRYRIYLSGASDGHDFGAPVAQTPAGATCIQLTSVDSPLIAVGQEVFLVVRAVDTEDAEDLNRVECPVTCVPTSAIAYVRPAEDGPDGLLGDPTRPFDTIQEGVDAIPSTGGVVLVAAGAYRELTAMTEGEGAAIAVFGSFDPMTFVAGATPEALLAGNDPADNPTFIDGVGVEVNLVGQIGHFDVRNDGRRTYVSALTFRDKEYEPLLGGMDVNLVLSCCSFLRVGRGDDEWPEHAILIYQDNGGAVQSLDVVGSYFKEIWNDTVEVDGAMRRLRVGSCTAEDSGDFLKADPYPPEGGTFDYRFEGNWITRIWGNVTDVYLNRKSEPTPGSVDIRVLGNRITGCDDDLFMNNIAGPAVGGTIDVLIERNFIGPTNAHCIEFRFIPRYQVNERTVDATRTTVTARNNTFVMVDDEHIDLENLNPGAGRTISVLVEDCTFLEAQDQSVEVGFAWEDEVAKPGPGQLERSQAGATRTVTLRDLIAIGTGGFLRNEMSVYLDGSTEVLVRDCVADAIMDDDVVDIRTVGYHSNEVGASIAQATESVVSVRVLDCDLSTSQREDGIEVDLPVLAHEVRCEIRGNDILSGRKPVNLNCVRDHEAVLRWEDDYEGDDYSGPVLELYVDLYVTIEGNLLVATDDEDGIQIEHGGRQPAWAYYNVCNNVIQSGEDALEFCDGLSDEDPGNGSVPGFGYLLVAHNTMNGIAETENLDLKLRESGMWSVLIARNMMLGGGDDGEPGIDLDVSTSVMLADIRVRNNLVGGTGAGIVASGSFQGVQMINNTVAFTGHEEDDQISVPLGGRFDGRSYGEHSPVYILNCLSHGNFAFDISPTTRANYTLFAWPPESEGYGALLLPDPVFVRHGEIFQGNVWFQLSPASPARDAGDPDPDFNDPNGTRNDLGAFGGPGAGRVGALESRDDPCPFLIVGLPGVDLFAGSLYPVAASRGEAEFESLIVVFSADVDAGTVNSDTLALEVNGTALSGDYVTDGRRVEFRLTGGYPAGALVKLVATPGLRSASGQALDFRHVRWFALPPDAVTPETTGAHDKPATAQNLGDENTTLVKGDLTGGGETDLYALPLAAGDRLQVPLFAGRMGSTGSLDFALRLWAPDGQTLLFENSSALWRDDPYIDFTVLQDGVFYIEVFDESGSQTSDISEYVLMIARFPR